MRGSERTVLDLTQGLEGIFWIQDFIKKTEQDVGFDCSREAGLDRIPHRMYNNNMKRKWDVGISQKRSGKMRVGGGG